MKKYYQTYLSLTLKQSDTMFSFCFSFNSKLSFKDILFPDIFRNLENNDKNTMLKLFKLFGFVMYDIYEGKLRIRNHDTISDEELIEYIRLLYLHKKYIKCGTMEVNVNP